MISLPRRGLSKRAQKRKLALVKVGILCQTLRHGNPRQPTRIDDVLRLLCHVSVGLTAHGYTNL